MPTEAQFEKASRGSYGSTGDDYLVYAFENTLSCAEANYLNCYDGILDVGTTLGVSPYGAYDMAGNAMEWTSDLYRGDYYCDPTETLAFVFFLDSMGVTLKSSCANSIYKKM